MVSLVQFVRRAIGPRFRASPPRQRVDASLFRKMVEFLEGLFARPHELVGFEGFVQLLLLIAAYGYGLCRASVSIARGSELLMTLPQYSGLIGSVVLPVLGAVPDGAFVLFSGLGPRAQTELAVGVGALAGSTVLILTGTCTHSVERCITCRVHGVLGGSVAAAVRARPLSHAACGCAPDALRV